jgi:diadenosine tetraphosphate (Ap4A) HIT family hydrolase
MTYEDLAGFIENQMSMSHIYQPLLIRTLIDAGGAATVRQIAQAFLSQDEIQLLHYEDTIKKMPVPVLSRHKVLKRDGQLVSLTVKKLTLEQRAHLRMLCEQRMQRYIQSRGLGIWDYRLLERDPVPDDLRYQVLAAGKGRCELCGATKDDRPLHVDHIIPRSRGGENEMENLQVLCSKCNTTKGNKDDRDFRRNLEAKQDPDCPFCPDAVKDRVIEENGTVVAIPSAYPVTDRHLLILPKRHTSDFFSMTDTERNHANELVRVMKRAIEAEDGSVTGFNVGSNTGASAGQTVFHAHIHIFPRRDGDTPDPRGGIRGAVPDKMTY